MSRSSIICVLAVVGGSLAGCGNQTPPSVPAAASTTSSSPTTIASSGPTTAPATSPSSQPAMIIGGGARYNRYAGTATITRVEKTDASNAHKGKAAEGFEVWYTFVPREEVKEFMGKSFLDRFKEFQFTLGYTGICPGPKFLAKYDMKPGKQFACSLLVEVEGTATPVLLEFDNVPADLFEAASRP